MHCFAQCEITEVLDRVGMNLSDLFPKKATYASESDQRFKAKRRLGFSPEQMLRGIAADALFIANVASSIIDSKPISDSDRSEMWVSAGRIFDAVEALS